MTYTAHELSRISGISRDQLMRWDRAGRLQAARGARGRRATVCMYTRSQALGVVALGELRRRGVSDRRLRAAAGLLPTAIHEDGFLVFDGGRLHVRLRANVLDALIELGSCHLLSTRDLAERLK